MKYILNSTGYDLRYPNFVKAENCTLYDSEGNKYLDLESGVWCTSIGHCHPQITKIITEQSNKMIHTGYCYLNPIIDSTAAKILEITGIESGKCVFLNSGSEAVEYSIKIIKSFSEKPYFLTMKNCYLSAYGISGERSNNDWIHFDWMNDDDIENLDFTQIAAFVFEPGSSLGLVNFPPASLVHKIVNKIRECGGYVITNEITTGVGRTGKWFGHQYYGFIPDIVAIGKGLGNGYPISCVAISKSVIERVDFSTFHHAQSHQNDPLGASVAGEVISVIDKNNLLQRAVKVGENIQNRINAIKEKYGIIKEVRGRGLMIAIEFENNDKYSFADTINEILLQKNIILVKRPGYEVFRIDPALTIEHEQIEYFLGTFERIISGIEQ
ncbi:aspartate aminotransferase family protein [Marispirochaeta aestuarii]|uniref:class-III pyridoxal-phosphate-dependent aminotransferase n=1 Tax=Marispirochaeta aestuarii TaxID=1963862 RepID=UPI002ABD3DA2|nr:aspartate aminotransferase family protein [Marispirochaeta aestuarii]